MSVDDIETVAVIGSGSMGHGITEVVAMAGYDVTMRDIEEDIVQEGYDSIEWSLGKLAENDRLEESPEDILARINTAVDLDAAVSGADMVIEAVPERMDLKKDVFSDLDEHAEDDAVLASNTSSLSITEIASATSRPGDVVGMHYFNPPVKMDLVEVIYGEETTDETAQTAFDFVEDIDKTPIFVRKDVNGFVVNSVLGPFGEEAGWMVSNGDVTVEEVDAAMVYGRGYPMGPFELGDMTGIDVGYHVRKEAGKEVPPIMEEKVEADELGRKTGKGYYTYDDGPGTTYEQGQGEGVDTLRIEARMVNEAAKLIGNDVATAEAIDTGMKLGAGFPEGICARADKLGLDTILEKLERLYEETGADRYEPADYLVSLVEEGKTGEDAGEGFYQHSTGDGPGEYRVLNWELTDDGLLAVELDRPERLNALNDDIRDAIVDLLTSVDIEDVRAVSFEGAGDRAFCAGADITGFADIEPAKQADPSELYNVVDEFPRPTLAKIEGFCLGGGFELALACDLRIATEDSQFGFPEITLGLLPGGGGTQRPLRMIGEARAKELVFRGEHIDAERAENWGLINRAVPAEEYEDTCEEFLSDLTQGPPLALQHAKRVMNEGADEDLDAGLQMESQAFALLLTTDDAKEGAAAFQEDRDPDFRGE